eukprot:m.274454 g.274454  ORF g.274454 m.274454 type:complete len:112 (+) comp54830_c1_seq23:199-534(+)
MATADDIAWALCCAVRDNNRANCQQIVLTCGGIMITFQCEKAPFNGATALHVAAVFGRHEIMEWFLQQQVNCNIFDHRSCTPLMSSVLSGSIKCVHALLQAGASSGITNAV